MSTVHFRTLVVLLISMVPVRRKSLQPGLLIKWPLTKHLVQTLKSDVTVNSTLTFNKGVLASATDKVIIPFTGSIAGAGQSTGWVNGNLQEYISSTAGGTFEIGNALYYIPVTETFNDP